jgi:hypothetical protein
MNNQISLNEALNKSEYPEYIKDKVKSFILENYQNYKDKSNTYLTKCFNKKIFVIKMDLPVRFKNIDYLITILIYIPVSFPNEIRIYFEYNQDFIVDKYYKEQNTIDETTAELYYQNIINFIPITQSINQLVQALIDKFNQYFPLFRSKSKPEYYGPCHLDNDSSTLIEIKPEDLKEIIKKEDNKKKIKDKIMQILEEKQFEIQATHSQLDSMKIKINNKINSYISKGSSNDIEDMNVKLLELISKLELDIKNLKNKKKNNILEQSEKVVEIKDKEKYKYIVMRKTAEDFLKYLKKGFERGIIPFNKFVDETRKISKELFYINYSIEKKVTQK